MNGPRGSGRREGERLPLTLRIVFLAKHLDHLMEHSLSLRGLNRTQSMILIALSRHDGLKALDLCAHARVEPANVTRTLQGLERQGLAERRPHPTDGRASLFYPTAAGRLLAADVDEEIRAASGRLFRDVADDDLAALEKGLGAAWRAISLQLSAGSHLPPADEVSPVVTGGHPQSEANPDNFDVERR